MTQELDALVIEAIETIEPRCAISPCGGLYQEMRFRVGLHYLVLQWWPEHGNVFAELEINGNNPEKMGYYNRPKITKFLQSKPLIAAFKKTFNKRRAHDEKIQLEYVEECNRRDEVRLVDALSESGLGMKGGK